MFDAAGKPVIRHTAGDLPRILNELGAALAEAFSDHLFTYAGRIARVHPAGHTAKGDIRRTNDALLVHPVEAAHLVELAGLAAIHERFDARGKEVAFVATDCPLRTCQSYLARGHWPELLPLRGFVEAPTLDPSGRIIDTPGYDPSTGLFAAFAPIAGYRRPPEKPTRQDADKALSTLRSLFETFPFAGAPDESAMLAATVTALLRRALPAAPMAAISAPAPGTGKTLLAEALALLVTSRRASVLSLGADDAEFEKRLAGALLAADALLCIDNLERPLKGDLLCQVTTQSNVRLRPLGGSAMLSVPTSAFLVATGNNLSIVGDLKRRALLVRLDAGTERPERREFSGDFLAEVAARRGELIGAALTLPLAYLAAGSPKHAGLHAAGSFESWDSLVRRPLVWLGLPDPLLSAEVLRAEDPDVEATRLLFLAWAGVFDGEPTTVADAIAAGMATRSMSGEIEHRQLYDALQVVCSEKANSRRLGDWLRRHKDKIADGLQLKIAGQDGHTKVNRWAVRRLGTAG